VQAAEIKLIFRNTKNIPKTIIKNIQKPRRPPPPIYSLGRNTIIITSFHT